VVPHLTRAQLASLASCDWVRAAHNLLIHGPTGSGKTFLACALAHQACRQGPVRCVPARSCHADGSFRKRLAALAKVSLIVTGSCNLTQVGI
jgi:chromosomal replication initiation ATPase DnaA